MTSRPVTVAAPAKVNLFLRVLRRSSSGYHVIETLFQAVSLQDSVTLTRAQEGVQVSVRGADLGPPEDNLAVRAARAFLAAADLGGGLEIDLVKRIPVGAGLGGGSSDAAAVLRGLSRLHPAAMERAEMTRLAAELGADVPFFLGASPLARGTAYGEVLTDLEPLPSVPVVLVCPPVQVSTPRAYRRLSEMRDVRGWPAEEHRRLPPSLDGWTTLNALVHNDFEEVVLEDYPEVAQALAALRGADCGPALLSGSGGACFALCADTVQAWRARDAVSAKLPGWPVHVVQTLESGRWS